ncbi:chitinase [[Emmonsia] crescens]|uniref:chitinase n=1 Tax=[Emmonsia] crescens TaxID=73230 RepID=A0A0G2I0D1_9EURO|nr:chitinase [Emmonsia crescens UAMH 3008]
MASICLRRIVLISFSFIFYSALSSPVSIIPTGATRYSTWNNNTGLDGQAPDLAQGLVSVAYFVNWAIYKRKFTPQDLPVEQLTHVLYAFANVCPESGEVFLTDREADTDKHFSGDSWGDKGKNVYGCVKQLFLLKKRNRNLKVLLSVGGWTFQKNFAQPSSSAAGRARFAESSTRLLLDLGFDGLDIDWEYPQDSNEAQDFVALLSTVRKSLDRAGGSSRRFLLTAAVPAGPEHYEKLRLQEMTPHVDFFNLMAYDYAGGFSAVAGHQANLEPSGDVPESTPFSTSAALDHYIHTGNVPPSKMVLGMPLYGRAFANTKGPGSPFQGVGDAGSWEHGIWDYKALPRPGSQEMIDDGARASWSYNPSTQLMISYDTEPMIKRKAQFILDSGLLGGMFWEASGDRRGRNGTQTGGSLIATFVESVRRHGKNLETTYNALEYPESRYDNLRTGFPDE